MATHESTLVREVHKLASVRVSRGISLASISADTKICVAYLGAIEEGKFDKLPGGVYRVNYLRQYADRVQSGSGERLLNAFRSWSNPPVVDESKSTAKRLCFLSRLLSIS